MSETERRRAAGAPDERPRTGGVIERETGRWRGVTVVALLAGALGILFSRPALVLSAALGVVFAAYARAGGAPDPDVTVERTLSESNPDPGDEVRVTLTVRNAGESVLPDLRIVDGVPSGLEVIDGSPRTATALRPGKAATFAYVVEAERGAHEFDAVTVLSRGFAGAVERERRVVSATTLSCEPRLAEGQPVPLRTQTTGYTGRVATDTGGAGTEFHSVREYRPGDPLNRVDWRRLARTGEFATVEFRQERAATVVLLVDTREEAYVAPPDGDSAVERSVAAAGEAFTSLLSTGDRVGLASFGPGSCWLAPSTGSDHRARARELLGTGDAFGPTPADEPFFASIELRKLRRRLPADAQLVVFTPLCDDYVASVVRRLDAYGHPVTVVSPDPTGDATPGAQLARVERDLRLSGLRRAGIRVIDWGEEPLATAFARARERWST